MDDSSFNALESAESRPMLFRQSLHDEVVQHLRDMIFDGTLKPGMKINELELCNRLGISRTPLREALKVLGSEGLLQLLPRRGAVVAMLTDQEVDELFPIIGAMEALAAETACRLIDDVGIAEIRAIHDRMIEAYGRRDWLGYSTLNRSIHDAIFAAARNGELVAYYRQLTVRIRSQRYQQQGNERMWQKSVEDHERIIEALEARDGSRIAGLMKEHLAHKAQEIREAVNRRSVSTPIGATTY